MGETVYVDILFIINFSMDFLCFYICSRIFGYKTVIWRAVSASVIGGVYSVLIICLDLPSGARLPLDISVLLLMSITAGCGGRPKFLGAAAYAGVSAALGGVMTAIFSILSAGGWFDGGEASGDGEMSAWAFALIAAAGAAASLVGGAGLRRRRVAHRVRVRVSFGDRFSEFDGLVDSGNLLCDPLSGKRVMVCELSALEGMIDPRTATMIRNGGITAQRVSLGVEKLRIIPACGALGDGLLCAVTPGGITITDPESGRVREADMLIAPVPRRLSADGCRALLPADVF